MQELQDQEDLQEPLELQVPRVTLEIKVLLDHRVFKVIRVQPELREIRVHVVLLDLLVQQEQKETRDLKVQRVILVPKVQPDLMVEHITILIQVIMQVNIDSGVPHLLMV
jgi:hypothetical protein